MTKPAKEVNLWSSNLISGILRTRLYISFLLYFTWGGLRLWIFCCCAKHILSNLVAIPQWPKHIFANILCNYQVYSDQTRKSKPVMQRQPRACSVPAPEWKPACYSTMHYEAEWGLSEVFQKERKTMTKRPGRLKDWQASLLSGSQARSRPWWHRSYCLSGWRQGFIFWWGKRRERSEMSKQWAQLAIY